MCVRLAFECEKCQGKSRVRRKWKQSKYFHATHLKYFLIELQDSARAPMHHPRHAMLLFRACPEMKRHRVRVSLSALSRCLPSVSRLTASPPLQRSQPAANRSRPSESSPTANPSGVQFRDVTAAAGIHFRHERAASDQKLYLETMGAGVGWIDYDQDGFLDIFFVNSGYTPFFHPAQPPQPALYRNNGDGTFTDVTAKAGIRTDGTFFFGVAVADFDNDGYPDIYMTGYRRSVLYHNNRDGTFTDITASRRRGQRRQCGERPRDGLTTTATAILICWSPIMCNTTSITRCLAAETNPATAPIATPTVFPAARRVSITTMAMERLPM